jgi:hypothetical protein
MAELRPLAAESIAAARREIDGLWSAAAVVAYAVRSPATAPSSA